MKKNLHVSPEMKALVDYQNHNYLLYKKQDIHISSLTISTCMFPIYKMKPTQDILKITSINIFDILVYSNEKLWFMMNGDMPHGIIIVNDIEPIRVGGENRSKDLYQIYQLIKHADAQLKDIIYFEFEGQGIFLVLASGDKAIYLSTGASAILNLPAHQKISTDDIVSKIKERIII
ncbi:hypothetical protein CN602_28835 [Bacillus cereus]|uniref:hypothetical protein n=1 Tax=Bacillus cereus TaxID=1396 RepID=UPI000BEF3B15|nr:hypothetical protein [Bacillus cereus]PEL95299.1 hypothetical protein CN602_28835 [Bacillus cereus]